MRPPRPPRPLRRGADETFLYHTRHIHGSTEVAPGAAAPAATAPPRPLTQREIVMKLLDRYRTVLFDMHGVLMFGHDRFGPHEDFDRSYRALGGRGLSESEVRRSILASFEGLRADARRPERYDDFLSVPEALKRYGDAPDDEIDRLTLVFALHEVGLVPDACAALLGRLARTHRLGLVTNVWAPKHFWLRELERVGVSDLFTSMVFSSDWRSIKPSSKLFSTALSALDAAPDEVLFVGDSLQHDVEGAKRAGLRTVWVTSEQTRHGSADHVVASALELEHAAA